MQSKQKTSNLRMKKTGNKKGWLISVSGLDGAGKSTLIDTITERIETAGARTAFVRIRLGFTPLLEGLKKLLHREEKVFDAGTEDGGERKAAKKNTVWKIYRLASMLDLLLLFLRIRMLRMLGKRVITDRFDWDNRIIFQEKYGDPDRFMELLWRIVRKTAGKPDAAFLLMIPPDESFRRVVARNQGVVEESPETLARRARLYSGLEQSGLVRIDAMQTPEAVFQIAWGHLEDLMV